ncbi:MAG: hypothetical protein KJ901_19400 [Gammaproteobacteria bacterium]|nr:hypothetical protein [Gammaproteobacteria bacterium]
MSNPTFGRAQWPTVNKPKKEMTNSAARCLSLTALLAATIAGMSFTWAATPPRTVQTLISQVDVLNERCRGGSGDDPATMMACDQRDALGARVALAGWCWGNDRQYGFEKKWQPCGGKQTTSPDTAITGVSAKDVVVNHHMELSTPKPTRAPPTSSGKSAQDQSIKVNQAATVAVEIPTAAPEAAPTTLMPRSTANWIESWSDLYGKMVGGHEAQLAFGALVITIGLRILLIRLRFKGARVSRTPPSNGYRHAQPAFGLGPRHSAKSASAQPSNVLEHAQGLASRLIVDGYRRIAAASGGGLAPTEKTSDRRILEVYQTVATAFQDAAQRRNEILTAGVIANIVLKFLQVEEMSDGALVPSHLNHEVAKYGAEGLRQEYRRELKLF